jgi:phosphoribosyl-ATP pyrophosphohydrolase
MLSQRERTARTDTLGDTLERLWRVIESRRGADPASSYTAKLLARGKAKVAQKFGEEAIEAVIEGARGERAALVGESADVLYHLMVMWAATGVSPADVAAELARREGISGISEKRARKEWASPNPPSAKEQK